MTSDDDISFSNSFIEEEIDIDTIDESGIKKAAKKSKGDTWLLQSQVYLKKQRCPTLNRAVKKVW